jgi:phosphohistidine phosphatase
MKTLLIVRHAKSSWKHVDVADHDRPLKKRGKRDAKRLGQQLLDRDLVPQLIISSTAKRARGTAKRIAKTSNYAGELTLKHELYHAGPMGYIRVIQSIDDRLQRVMIVGHNPALEVLLEVLTGEARWLPTGAMVCVDLPVDTWPEVQEYLKGEVVCHWTRHGPIQLQGTVARTL